MTLRIEMLTFGVCRGGGGGGTLFSKREFFGALNTLQTGQEGLAGTCLVHIPGATVHTSDSNDTQKESTKLIQELLFSSCKFKITHVGLAREKGRKRAPSLQDEVTLHCRGAAILIYHEVAC